MLDPQLMAVATNFAGALAAEAVVGNIENVRQLIRRALRHASEQDHAQQVALVEADAEAFSRGAASKVELQTRWAAMVAAYLAMNPDALDEVAALVTERVDQSMYVAEQHNHAGGTFVGRDNYGPISDSAAGR